GRVRDDDVGDESAARGRSVLLRLAVCIGFRRGGTQDFLGHWLPPGRVERCGLPLHCDCRKSWEQSFGGSARTCSWPAERIRASRRIAGPEDIDAAFGRN